MDKIDNMQAELSSAIQNNEFVLHYQPQYDIATERLEALEALIRWQHPTRGLLLPGHFLPQAEENGMMVPIGEWVLKAACKQNNEWRDKKFKPIRIAINVSGKQFLAHNFVTLVKAVLEQYQLSHKLLEVELTENIILHDQEVIVAEIKQLHELGISIALDDFGTGYSSISHLKKIPVDRIKIDKTLIQSIDKSRSDATIVQAIITLAKGLHLRVLAEGVETEEQLEILQSMQCNEVQGYYFSEAITPDAVEKLLSVNS